MAKVDYNEISDELVYFFRNQITDPEGRGTDSTETFNGDSTTTDFELANEGVKNISAVSIGGTSKDYGTDYSVVINTVSTGTGIVSFTSAPATGTDNVSITYHHGQTWVYPDRPRKDITIGSYPRIAVLTVASTINQIGLGTGMSRTNMLKDIKVLGKNENQVNDIINDVKNAIINNKKKFYNFSFIEPIALSPLLKDEDTREEIVSMNLTCQIPLIFES